MKKYMSIFAVVTILLAFKAYSNYQSYPKYQPRTITIQTEEEDDINLFYAWNPTGRDRPVYKDQVITCKHGGNRNGSKYIDMEITKKYLQWGM